MPGDIKGPFAGWSDEKLIAEHASLWLYSHEVAVNTQDLLREKAVAEEFERREYEVDDDTGEVSREE